MTTESSSPEEPSSPVSDVEKHHIDDPQPQHSKDLESQIAQDARPPNVQPSEDKPLEKETSSFSDDAISRQASRPLAESFTLPHEILFVGIICLAQLTTQAGFGQALLILHDIGQSFNISTPGELSWLVAGYSLTVGTFILVSGRLGDIFGYKRMLLIGYAWFSIWSMIAGLAIYSGSVLFIFARVLSGIGPAILLPNGVALLGASYANGSPRKDMVFALFGACAPGTSIYDHWASSRTNVTTSQAAQSSVVFSPVFSR